MTQTLEELSYRVNSLAQLLDEMRRRLGSFGSPGLFDPTTWIAEGVNTSGTAHFTDFDTVDRSGFYIAENAAHAPYDSGGIYGLYWALIHLEPLVPTGGNRLQLAMKQDVVLTTPVLYLRTGIPGGVWAAWQPVHDDTGWIAPLLATNWSNFGGSEVTAAYRLTNGIVELRGLVKKSVALVAGDVIFTLPSFCIPAKEWIFVAASAGGYTELRVGVTGLVYIQAGGSASWTSLAGVRFDKAAL